MIETVDVVVIEVVSSAVVEIVVVPPIVLAEIEQPDTVNVDAFIYPLVNVESVVVISVDLYVVIVS